MNFALGGNQGRNCKRNGTHMMLTVWNANDHMKHKPRWDGFLCSRTRLTGGEPRDMWYIGLRYGT